MIPESHRKSLHRTPYRSITPQSLRSIPKLIGRKTKLTRIFSPFSGVEKQIPDLFRQESLTGSELSEKEA